MAAALCIKLSTHRKRASTNVDIKHQSVWGWGGALSDFDRGMVAGAGLRISETAGLTSDLTQGGQRS